MIEKLKNNSASVNPTKRQLLDAAGKSVPDIIAPDLRILFCGINPGLYSAAVGHHFARPGNRFWPALHGAGLTPRLLFPFEARELLNHGLGITNVVARATSSAGEVTQAEFARGQLKLERKVKRFQPRCLAFLGLGAYRTAFGLRTAELGPQLSEWEATSVWLLPNPSGRNAHFQLTDFIHLFRKLLVFI